MRIEGCISGHDDPSEREAEHATHSSSLGAPIPAVQRQGLDSPALPQLAPDPLPPADELAAQIANSIGVWETNRGKNVPVPKESKLETVAGVHASMATIEQ